jgi:hypothetical protein
MSALLIILAAVAAIWFWNDTLNARERMLARCRAACEEIGVQLLDETVALKRLGVARNRHGRVAIRRRYQFEFSADGQDRWPGHATLLGLRVESLQLEGPDGLTILGAGRVLPFPGQAAAITSERRH